MTTYSLQALRDAREQRLARICVPTQVPIDALACWNGQRFVSWNEWLLSLGFTDHTKHDTTQIELASVDEIEKNNIPRPNLREFGDQTVLF